MGTGGAQRAGREPEAGGGGGRVSRRGCSLCSHVTLGAKEPRKAHSLSMKIRGVCPPDTDRAGAAGGDVNPCVLLKPGRAARFGQTTSKAEGRRAGRGQSNAVACYAALCSAFVTPTVTHPGMLPRLRPRGRTVTGSETGLRPPSNPGDGREPPRATGRECRSRCQSCTFKPGRLPAVRCTVRNSCLLLCRVCAGVRRDTGFPRGGSLPTVTKLWVSPSARGGRGELGACPDEGRVAGRTQGWDGFAAEINTLYVAL